MDKTTPHIELPKKEFTPEEIGGLLFGIHFHVADFVTFPDEDSNEGTVRNPSQIVYREEDVIRLLRVLGHNAPKWGIYLKLGDYE